MTLCEMTRMFGGSWGSGDVIVLASDKGLFRVSATGGELEMLANVDTEKGEVEYRQPEFLPDGKTVLFTIGGANSFQIAVLSLETGEKKIVVEGGREAHYAPTGHLVYEAADTGTLMAVAFDPERLEIKGKPVPVFQGIRASPGGTVDYAFSDDGTLVYVPAQSDAKRTLVWVDRQGKTQPLTEIQRAFLRPRLSPDGRRVAVTIGTANQANIWIYDIARGTLTPLTFDGHSRFPVWAPDGKRLAFASDRTGFLNLFWMPADGTGEAQQLSTSLERQTPASWSPDGVLVYTQSTRGTDGDIWVLSLDGEWEPRQFYATQFFELHPMLSPDGRWIAFVSAQSGQNEVYLKPYPGPGGMIQISTDGGQSPSWAPNGRELFYRNQDDVIAVSVQTEPTFEAGTPKLLFQGTFAQARGIVTNYDVDSADRFLMIEEEDQGPGQIHVILNWFEELKRLVPTD